MARRKCIGSGVLGRKNKENTMFVFRRLTEENATLAREIGKRKCYLNFTWLEENYCIGSCFSGRKNEEHSMCVGDCTDSDRDRFSTKGAL